MLYFPLDRNLLMLFLLTAFNCWQVSATTSNNDFQIYRLENGCPDQNVPIELRNISIKLEDLVYFVRFDVEVHDDVAVSEDLKVEFKLTRCLQADPSSCKKYETLIFPHFCQIMELPGPWSIYMDTMIPPFHCPVKEGSYKMSQSISCDLKYMKRLNLVKGYVYTIDVKHYGMTSNQLLFCAVCEGST